MNMISGKKSVSYWFNPRIGSAEKIGTYDNTGVIEFTPPTKGSGEDWVLVLDDSSRNYPYPGQEYKQPKDKN